MAKILLVANTDMHINLCYLPYIKYLKEQGHIVHVVTNTGVTIEYSDKKIKVPIHRTPWKFGNIQAIIALKKVIDEEKYDLISCSTPMGGVVARIAAIKARKKNNTKIIYTAHGFHFYKGCPLFNKLIYYPVEKILAKYTDIMITINEEDYKFALNHFPIDIRYIEGIGYDDNKLNNKLTRKEKATLRRGLGINRNDYVITYIAELSVRKRQKYLIKALSNMNLENIKVLLVGDNILGDTIYKLIRKKKMENIIKVLGFRNDISNILDITDLVISVSKQEGLPLNIMEAMKKEKPIIVTNCRGNRDLIRNGKNGIVIPINNPSELVKKVTYLKNSPTKALRLAKENVKYADKYKLNVILPKYVKIYNEVLDEN